VLFKKKNNSNTKVFNWYWNNCRVHAKSTSSRTEFQICEAATGKAQPPMVEFERQYDQAIGADTEHIHTTI